MPRWLSSVLVAVASVIAFTAVLAIWIDRQVLDTANWADASSRLLENPAIRAQTARYLADKAYENGDLEARIADVLPPRAQALAPAAASLARDRIERRANEALARPEVQRLWEDANRSAHTRLLEVLENDGPVVVDLKALLAAVERRAGVGGRAAAAVPAGAAQVTILQSGQLESVRAVTRVLGALPIVLVSLSLTLFGAALAVSPGERRRVVRGYGLGLVSAGALALGAAAWMGEALVASVTRTAASVPAADAVWEISTTLLVEAATATLGYGAVVLAGAWLAGKTRPAVAVRRTLAPVLREPELAYGAFAVVAGIVILWWAPTPATRNPVTALVLVALMGLGLEALRRQTAREFPRLDLPPADASAAPAPADVAKAAPAG
jgi:hypothetical protein